VDIDPEDAFEALRPVPPPGNDAKAVNYIEEHLAEPISLAALGQLVRLSPNYFCRAFSQSFGMPPQRYHTRQRIERAKTLLAKRFRPTQNLYPNLTPATLGRVTVSVWTN
jgi:AraC-like DNA-binding protein